MKALELKIQPPVLALITAIGMWFLSALMAFLSIDLPGREALSILLLITGGVAGFAGIFAFRHAHTTVDPRTPSATRVLVTIGIYGLTRNPMYLGILLILVAWLIFLGNLLPIVLLPLFVLYMNRFQIAPEERVLREKFGDEYAEYQNKVRRWL
ncbi:methyltransferase family protein [Granulosicoccus antarcticus]|uniref:Steroid 5-alpha reductase C-terminal domain-containing protein n=1 Tax=Granulosicoccus antarcticus IMCC3135 TaxID=1192854 RepID=A0A2Z2P5J7_9GAMM|nr:isoprenylcysteine carboxylmethyltransferase family protein [Granulosicoccus antarcticus]ASJ75104.1 hypothetical protein IMCC3135_25205 [Granulosicoccus antarcticus IMCC3135]